MKKILLTGGGTAGHVTPNMALIPSLKQQYELYYIGSKKGIEKSLIANTAIPYKAISTGKLRRYFSWENFKDLFRVIIGILQAFFYIKRIKPSLVFSKGGFVAVPVVLAAKLCHIPIICHESDLTPGIATKISAKFAQKVCCTFEKCAAHFGSKGVYTGTPIRSKLFGGDAETIKKKLQFDDKPTILIMGGSQGAQAINDAIHAIIDNLLEKYNVIHIAGSGKIDASLLNKKGYIQIEYIDDELADIMALADIVISRAGSNSISELHALKKPMLLIPLPKTSVSRGDQIENAKYFGEKGFAKVLMQECITNNSLLDSIEELYKEKDNIISNMQNDPAKQGTDIILGIIKNIAN